ncbi:MAG: endolytic transglycosylase MltG [Actinobacteria bacterium]|nr:endolytic transglycosylase MltG [Actinomycetota bacterium]
MSQVGLSMTSDTSPNRPPTKKTKKSRVGLLIVLLIVIGVIAGAAWFAYSMFFAPSPDYVGEGTGRVVVRIEDGQSISAIGDTLAEKDVVKSGGAFVDAAEQNSESRSIQSGVFVMKSQMSGAAALDAMLNPSRIPGSVVIPEGSRAAGVAEIASEATGIPIADYDAIFLDPSDVGLPDWANNHIEGYLFPATYDFAPGLPAKDQITAMVAKFNEVAVDIKLEERAEGRGQTPLEIVTIASIIQAESKIEDFRKVARVIDNRLACTLPVCKSEFIQGRLQMDSTINYAQGTSDVNLSAEELSADGPYNTYKNAGLPPTPIGNPGQEALEAALDPAKGNWLYFVSDTNFTAFSETFDEQQAAEAKWRASTGQ